VHFHIQVLLITCYIRLCQNANGLVMQHATVSSHVQPAYIKKDLTSRIQSCNLLHTEDHITQMSNSFYILIIILLTAMKEKLLQDGTECNGLTGLPSIQQ
jgi:hypothetical protein